MYGEPDPLYVRARCALLDATDALEPQLDAFVLVGAQAVYLRTGDTDLAVAEYTTDADFAIQPGDLTEEPLLADRLASHEFSLRRNPGAWLTPDGIAVDIMVPEALAGPGSRAARLGVHGKIVARRAKGLEGALVDRDRLEIGALNPTDNRTVEMWVAGPAALLVAKIIKISERVGGTRVADKDALDVLRLLRSTEIGSFVERIDRLRAADVSAAVTAEAIELLGPLFRSPESDGVAMVVRAARVGVDPEFLARSIMALIDDLQRAL